MEPLDPTTPVDPTDRTPAGEGPATVAEVVRDGAVSSVTTMVAAASAPATASMLARTGATTGILLATAVLLMALGMALTALSRRRVGATA